MTRQLQGIELKRGELQGRLAANKAWEPLNFKDTRRQLNSILAEEERYQCVRARRYARGDTLSFLLTESFRCTQRMSGSCRLRRILRQRVAEQRPGMIGNLFVCPWISDGRGNIDSH